LEYQFKKMLTEDRSLAEEAASGDRSVAIGGDATGNTIITGDRNR
jgi:hypothetical protein